MNEPKCLVEVMTGPEHDLAPAEHGLVELGTALFCDRSCTASYDTLTPKSPFHGTVCSRTGEPLPRKLDQPIIVDHELTQADIAEASGHSLPVLELPRLYVAKSSTGQIETFVGKTTDRVLNAMARLSLRILTGNENSGS